MYGNGQEFSLAKSCRSLITVPPIQRPTACTRSKYISSAKDLNTPLQEAHLLPSYRCRNKDWGDSSTNPLDCHTPCNFYLRRGQPDKAMMLQQSVQLSIAHQHHLVTVPKVLSYPDYGSDKGKSIAYPHYLYRLRTQQPRTYWIAFATARNTRASCLLIPKTRIGGPSVTDGDR